MPGEVPEFFREYFFRPSVQPNMKRCILWLALVMASLAAVSTLPGAGLIIVQDPSWWPGPFPPHPPPWPHPHPWQPHIFAPLEITSIKADTRIADQIAQTTVNQEFYNPNPVRLEGTFIFPVPKGAHLDKFTLEINGKPVAAELLPAAKARGIYEEIVRKLRDPGLLEYAERDLFKVRAFPIEPHSHKRISLSYTQLLTSDNGLVSYTLPLSMDKFSARPIKTVSVKVELESRRPIKSIYSPSHTVEISRHGPNRATASYEAGEAQPDADFALYFAPEKDAVGLNLLTYRTGDKDGYFLLLASPGVDTPAKQVVPKDVVFVLDTSGSMAGKKLDQAKKALVFCVENLNAGDRFELLRFSTEVEPLFDNLVAASAANRARAEAFVKDLKPMGATALDDALRKALALRASAHKDGESDDSRPFMVIFLTDGMPTIGVTDPDQIVAHAKEDSAGRTRVFCFGIGTDVNAHLLDRITEATRAISQYVLPEEDLEVKLSSFFSKISDPVLANPALRLTGDIRVTKLYPAALPDLFKGEQLVLVGRYSGHGPAAVVIDGTVNGAARQFSYDANFPQDSCDNAFIPRLWATRRVGYLLDEIRLHGENAELRDEVTALAREYGIVTPYTAYLIVEDEARRGVADNVRSLPQLARNSAARQEAASSWAQFKSASSGDAGVASAMSGLALRSATAPSAAAAGAEAAFQRRYGLAPAGPQAAYARRYGGAGAGAGPATSPYQYRPAYQAQSPQQQLVETTQQSRFAGGKTFFLNANSWVDSAVQTAPKANRIRLQFGSPEYFDFIAGHSQALPWVALGQNVQFLLDGTVYVVGN
jgi:Ca-activated chloride channel homolog